jgi:prepilin-type N-terminal cleavage/methylation domain-containing protein
MTTTRRNRQPRAFSLIELMIVILIIAMIIAIVVPALGHARKAARKSASQELMVQVEQACTSFQLSERRMPGYFSAKDMGSTLNGTQGFTGMENVMFDLGGGVVAPGSAPSPPPQYPGAFRCGPGTTAATQVWYSTDQVGVAQGSNKAYFTPPAKYFKSQDPNSGAIGMKIADPATNMYVKDLVDAEGTPILLWAADPMSVQPVAAPTDFAALNTQAGPARFYWNTNAAFLNSAACGDKRIDQTTKSLIGSGNTTGTPPANITSLMGILGNPSSPQNLTPPSGPILPTAGRGAFILQSAGSDATFVGKDERGGKTANNLGTTLDFGLNFRSSPSSDLMKDFDDIIVAGGG